MTAKVDCMNMNRKSIIMDCDPGHDDAIALILACASDRLDVRAVTTVGATRPWKRRRTTPCAY